MNQTELNKSRIAEYNKAHVNDSAFSICDEWDESKHPRAANGQFGSGGATSAPTKASKAPAKANTSTPAEKPAQAPSGMRKVSPAYIKMLKTKLESLCESRERELNSKNPDSKYTWSLREKIVAYEKELDEIEKNHGYAKE